jgi:hypothetical protein
VFGLVAHANWKALRPWSIVRAVDSGRSGTRCAPSLNAAWRWGLVGGRRPRCHDRGGPYRTRWTFAGRRRSMRRMYLLGRNGLTPSRRAALGRLLLPLLAALTLAAEPAPSPAEGCPANRPCHGCGCAGGPGYRAPDGHCVGFRDLTFKCGTPPTERCTFENAPGTGAHAECAIPARNRHKPLVPANPDGQ